MRGVYSGHLPDEAPSPSPRLNPDTPISVCAIWPPSTPMIPEYVGDNEHRSGKWTSGAPVQHRTHSTAAFFRVYVQVVWWFGGHAWWRSGSLRPGYWPTNQLADHMDGDYILHSPLHSFSLRPLPHPFFPLLYPRPPPAQVSLLAIALLLTCSFFLMNHWVHLHRSGNSTLVIPHVSHWVLFRAPAGDS